MSFSDDRTMIQSFEIPETKYRLAGAANASIIILQECYDADQLWLPFVDIFVFPVIEKEVPIPYTRHNFKKTSHVCQRMYLYSFDSEQLVLPFREGKQLTNRMLRIMEKRGFPLWDKKDENIIQVEIFTNESRQEIIEWCSDNLQKHFHLKSSYSSASFTFTLESEIDALMIKMRFS